MDNYSRQGSGNGNNFFLKNFNPDRESRGRIYAAIEVPDNNEDDISNNDSKEPIYLECIDYYWFHRLNENDDWLNLYDSAPLSVLELTNYPLPPFPEELKAGDIAWFEFGYSKSNENEGDAIIYFNMFSPGSSVKIEYYEPRSIGWAGNSPCGDDGWLTKSLDFKMETKKEIKTVLSCVKSDNGVVLYDVGQGACQAVIDDDGFPSLYIDFGGGVLGNEKTFPTEYNGFCFSQNPAIILSHWDWDHWSSAYRFGNALSAQWIAPSIPQKPVQQAFAAHLYSLGNLAIIADDFPGCLRSGVIRIERCTGKTVNDSGLAVTVFQRKGKSRNCLIPGDSTYKFIPSVLKGEKFSSLCMTHHGGRLHSKVLPKPKQSGKLVCSVGAGNSYRHPFLNTIEAHTSYGWSFPLTTGFAGDRPNHVLLPWGTEPKLFIGRCRGGDFCNGIF